MKSRNNKMKIILIITISFPSLILSLTMKNIDTLQSPNNDRELNRIINNGFFSLNECDIITEGPICTFNGKKIILPNAELNGLKLYYSFDQIRAIDESGNGNHGKGEFFSGPSFTGIGNSAFFKNGLFIEIPYNKFLYDSDFTFTFYLFIMDDPNNEGERFCPFIQKGLDKDNNYERYPAIYYDRQEKNLNIYIKTNNNDDIQGEKLISLSKFFPQKWYHISLVKENKNLKLYVNTIPDNSITLKGEIENNESNIYLGNVPWLNDNPIKYKFYSS